MANAFQCPLLHFFNQIFSKFHIWIASIKLSLKFEYVFCPTKVNQDGQRNGRRLLVCTYRHSTLVIYYRIGAKFQIYITFIKLSPKFEYGLCPITKMVATCQFTLVDTIKMYEWSSIF